MGFQRVSFSFEVERCWAWEAETTAVMEVREWHGRGGEREMGRNGEKALEQRGETLQRGTLQNLIFALLAATTKTKL